MYGDGHKKSKVQYHVHMCTAVYNKMTGSTYKVYENAHSALADKMVPIPFESF